MKYLFIDRDGTLIKEPPDEQIDSLEKLSFVPGAISALRALRTAGFTYVLATNQDGLGTPAFPEEAFWPAHRKMLETLAGEGIEFADQLIDRSFPADGNPGRKPGTGMFGAYLGGACHMAQSYVIGDRPTDIRLALNLGCKGILLRTPAEAEALLSPAEKAALALATDSWEAVASFLATPPRTAETRRTTRETDILCRVNLDAPPASPAAIDTGLHFFDHMLSQIPHHAGIALELACKGDLEVDEHHTMEDCAIALGRTLRLALGEKRGIERYGFVLPMDESRALCLLDLGGRTHFTWDVHFTREYVGDTPTEMYEHFFQSLAAALGCNLHLEARGTNQHHLAESLFKAFARALRQAVRRDGASCELPTSKGVL